MVRKYFIEQVLAKCEGFAKVLLGLFILGSFSACDQEMSEPVPQFAKVVDSLQVAPATRSSARSLETTSPGWSEGSYDTFIASKYTIPTPVRIQSDYYKFRVVPSDGNTIEVWIKYFSPQGNIVYQQMERRGNSFEIQRIFQQEGKYSYAFFVKRFGSGGYPRISQQGLSVNVKLPIRIPPEGDDYKKFVNINKSSDQWDFDVKQCVSWVALKVNQMWGTEKDFTNKMFGPGGNRLGYAYNWARILSAKGYLVDDNPKAGDIIWWDKNPKDEREGDGSLRARANGHVGFVYKVTPTTVYYTEYNGRVLNGYFPNQIERSAIRLPKFIHVQKKIH